MSTAPHPGASKEADYSLDLKYRDDAAHVDAAQLKPSHTKSPTAPVATPMNMAVGPAGVALEPASKQFYEKLADQLHEVEQSDDDLDSSVLEDTVTFRIDDTDLDFPAGQLAKLAAHRTSADGSAAIAIDVPSAVGPLDGLLYDSIKRCIDIVISATALIILSPLLLLSAVVVKVTDGGSVFYKHTRVGERGSEFSCYKFRSMVVNAEKMKAELAFFNSHDDHRTFKIPNDPRVTSFGRLMRRTSIDELPQLWNVLKGDMSIVGPRPPVVTEVEQYTWDDMQRLAVKPGLTCIWQVSGRSRLPFPEQLKMDLEYIENRSLALDLKLIAQTIPAVLSADGAY